MSSHSDDGSNQQPVTQSNNQQPVTQPNPLGVGIGNLTAEQLTQLVVSAVRASRTIDGKRDRPEDDNDFFDDEEEKPSQRKKRRIFEQEADSKAALFARQFDFPEQIFPSGPFYTSDANPLRDVEVFLSRQPLREHHRITVNERFKELNVEMTRYLNWVNLMSKLEMEEHIAKQVQALLEENSNAWLSKATVVCFAALFPYLTLADVRKTVSHFYEKYTQGISNKDVIIRKWYNLAINKAYYELAELAREGTKKYEEKSKAAKNASFRGD